MKKLFEARAVVLECQAKQRLVEKEIELEHLQQKPKREPLTDEQIKLADEAVDQIMEQAQVFASAWSLVGGRFDFGNAKEDAEQAKTELRTMVVSLAHEAAHGIKENT